MSERQKLADERRCKQNASEGSTLIFAYCKWLSLADLCSLKIFIDDELRERDAAQKAVTQ